MDKGEAEAIVNMLAKLEAQGHILAVLVAHMIAGADDPRGEVEKYLEGVREDYAPEDPGHVLAVKVVAETERVFDTALAMVLASRGEFPGLER